MIGWVHMSPLQKMQRIYVQTYKDLYDGSLPCQISVESWESLTWLDSATDKLIDKIMKGDNN